MLTEEENQRMMPVGEANFSGSKHSVEEKLIQETYHIQKINQNIIGQNENILKLLYILLLGIIIVLLVLMIFAAQLSAIQGQIKTKSMDPSQKIKMIKINENQLHQKRKKENKMNMINSEVEKREKQQENKFKQKIEQQQKQNQKKRQQQLQKYKLHKIEKRTLYNAQNFGKRFAKISSFLFNITELIPDISSRQHSMRSYETHSSRSSTFVLEPKDFDKLFGKINYDQLQKNLSSSISHEVLQFEYNEKVERKGHKISLERTQEQIQSYIDRIVTNQMQNDERAYKIAYELYRDENSKEVLEAQYHYANKKYKIGENKQEAPICIISTGRNLYSRNQYDMFFDSLEKVNYTNYHIVYVDDFSTDDSAYHIYNYIRQKNFTFINNIKIIHNLQNLGCLANVFFWVKKYCNQNDIVVNIDGDDAILMPQAFQILNSVYKNSSKWFAYSKFVVTNTYNKDVETSPLRKADASIPLNTTINNYRRSGWFMTSHMRTYRQKLMKAVPIYEVLEFHFDRQTGLAYPTFPSFTSDVYQVYSLLELAGEEKVQFIPDYFYLYFFGISFETRNCYRFHQLHDNLKASLKPRLNRIDSLDQKATRVENDGTILQWRYNQLQVENDEAMASKCYEPSSKS